MDSKIEHGRNKNQRESRDIVNDTEKNAERENISGSTTTDLPSTLPIPLEPSSSPVISEDLDTVSRVKKLMYPFTSALKLLLLLYIFICSLGLLGNAFQLFTGKTAGNVLSANTILTNPVAGVIVGIIVTVFVHSSSTSTSIIVAMVAASLISVAHAIPIIMGANIGTSVTNTLVALAHSGKRTDFGRAFSGAVVHDVFNVLSVIVFLPIEVLTGYLYRLSSEIVDAFKLRQNKGANIQFLNAFTKPVIKLIIQLDNQVLSDIATGNPVAQNKSLIRHFCKTSSKNLTRVQIDNSSSGMKFNQMPTEDLEKCKHLFAYLNLSDTASGVILLLASLFALCITLVVIVRVLYSILKGKLAIVIHKTLNTELPGHFACLTGYLAMLVGVVMTILLQSSSIFTSAITPLIGVGIVDLERAYPLTLGSNLGTTFTAILAALAAPAERVDTGLQVALSHLLFNMSGILVWHTIPRLRKVPIHVAQYLGETTATYRWFAIVYILFVFLLFPLLILGLTIAGRGFFITFSVLFIGVIFAIISLHLLQRYIPDRLPEKLQTFQFLPLWLRSLEPYDVVLSKLMCNCCVERSIQLSQKVMIPRDLAGDLPRNVPSCEILNQKNIWTAASMEDDNAIYTIGDGNENQSSASALRSILERETKDVSYPILDPENDSEQPVCWTAWTCPRKSA